MLVLPIHFGTKLYGRIERCGPSCIATLFLHLWYVPLAPLRSFLVLEEHGDGTFESIQIPLSPLSVLRGLAWLMIAACGVAAAIHPAVAAPAVLLALLALLPYATGHLTRAERRQREIYGELFGWPIDVARLPEERKNALRARLAHALEEHARMRESGGAPYRDRALSLDENETDPRILDAALTLARLDGDRKAHAAIWQRLERNQRRTAATRAAT